LIVYLTKEFEGAHTEFFLLSPLFSFLASMYACQVFQRRCIDKLKEQFSAFHC